MQDRPTLTVAGATLWTVLGGSVALAGLGSVNRDALLLVGFFTALGPALAAAAALTAARGSLQRAGLLLAVSALATPTYFAYPLNLLVLVSGMWLAVTSRSTSARDEPEPA